MAGTPENLLRASAHPNKILILCPHPDDFDVAGVTLRHFFESGSQLHVAVAPTSSGILDSFYPAGDVIDDAKRIATRSEEQRQSLLFFGLTGDQFTFFPNDTDLDDNGEMTGSPKNASIIQGLIDDHRPDAIFIPHPNDHNPAHAAMHRCVVDALGALGHRATLYQQIDPKTRDVPISAFTPLSESDVAWKTELLLHHQTQNHRNLEQRGISIAERILLSNKDIATAHSLPCDHAEAFEIIS